MDSGFADATRAIRLIIRPSRVCEDSGGVRSIEAFLLPNLAIPAHLFLDIGSLSDASLRCCVLELESGDADRLYRRRLCYRAAARHNRSGARVAVYVLEFHCRTEWLPDSITVGRSAAVPRAAARAGRCVHRMPDLQAAY